MTALNALTTRLADLVMMPLAGLPPARWLAEEGLPSVQDEAADERAGWAP